jgi:multidrug efflux pump subunit AcrB
MQETRTAQLAAERLRAAVSVGFCLIFLWLSGHPLGFTAILGIVSMIGVEINDAMLVLMAIQTDPQAQSGDRTAIREVVVRSTPHVIATTVTAVMG